MGVHWRNPENPQIGGIPRRGFCSRCPLGLTPSETEKRTVIEVDVLRDDETGFEPRSRSWNIEGLRRERNFPGKCRQGGDVPFKDEYLIGLRCSRSDLVTRVRERAEQPREAKNVSVRSRPKGRRTSADGQIMDTPLSGSRPLNAVTGLFVCSDRDKRARPIVGLLYVRTLSWWSVVWA